MGFVDCFCQYTPTSRFGECCQKGTCCEGAQHWKVGTRQPIIAQYHSDQVTEHALSLNEVPIRCCPIGWRVCCAPSRHVPSEVWPQYGCIDMCMCFVEGWVFRWGTSRSKRRSSSDTRLTTGNHTWIVKRRSNRPPAKCTTRSRLKWSCLSQPIRWVRVDPVMKFCVPRVLNCFP